MTDDLSRHRLLQVRWEAALERNAEGAPLLPPLFVLQQGPGVHIIDLRASEEAGGPSGYIPGSVFLGADRLRQLVPELQDDLPLVLVSRTGEDAALTALELQRAGMRCAAAMTGGLAAWRRLGFGTSRDPAGVSNEWAPVAGPPPVEGTLSLEQVRAHVGDPRSVRWVKLASMATYKGLACVDGRDERGLVGTPGGDAGEFLLACAALERTTGKVLQEDDLARQLQRRLDLFGDFYMHTDGDAFEALVTALRADPRIGAAAGNTAAESYEFLSQPPPEVREALLEHLVHPDHIGCGHIRLTLQNPEEYGSRSDLVVAFLRCFYRLWWDGAPELSLTLLPGGHEEAAVANVRLAEKPWALSKIPLVAPACGGSQIFVNHADVTSYLRRNVVEFHVRGLGPVPVEDGDTFGACLDELATQPLRTAWMS